MKNNFFMKEEIRWSRKLLKKFTEEEIMEIVHFSNLKIPARHNNLQIKSSHSKEFWNSHITTWKTRTRSILRIWTKSRKRLKKLARRLWLKTAICFRKEEVAKWINLYLLLEIFKQHLISEILLQTSITSSCRQSNMVNIIL